MLLELTIKNIALIESLRIEFVQGFNVLTGETGAGKSIVVDCVNLALGGRAEREIIRSGAERGSVQALFDISKNAAALEMAETLGLDIEDGLACVARELSRSGRNICRISGSVLPLSVLRQFTALLVDVHGQHEHQALMDPARHIDFLDSFGDAAHAQLIRETAALHAQRSQAASALRAILPDAVEAYYSVKANPHPRVAGALVAAGDLVDVRHIEAPVAKRGEDPMPGLTAFRTLAAGRAGYAGSPTPAPAAGRCWSRRRRSRCTPGAARPTSRCSRCRACWAMAGSCSPTWRTPPSPGCSSWPTGASARRGCWSPSR